MRKPSEKLHILIHSLTPQEKRYFKMFARHYGGEKKYLEIFDVINSKAGIYNEEIILTNIQDEELKNYFNRYKNYLYSLILRSLEQFHTASSNDLKILSEFKQYLVLKSKGLYDYNGNSLANSVLKRSKKLLEKENMSQFLPWLIYEEQSTENASVNGISVKESDIVAKDYYKVLEAERLNYEVISKYYLFQKRLQETNFQISDPLIEEVVKRFETIEKTALFQLNDESTSRLYCLLREYYLRLDNKLNYFHYAETALQFISKQVEENKLITLEVIRSYKNYIYTLISDQQYINASQYISTLSMYWDKYKHDGENVNFEAQRVLLTLSLVNAALSRKQSEVIMHTNTLEMFIKGYKHYFNHHKMFVTKFYVAWGYIYQNKWSKALPILNKLLDEEKLNEVYSETLAFAHLYYLLGNINENKNTSILKYIIQHTKSYFKKATIPLFLNEIKDLVIKMGSDINKPQANSQVIIQKFHDKLKLQNEKKSIKSFLLEVLVKWTKNQLDLINGSERSNGSSVVESKRLRGVHTK